MRSSSLVGYYVLGEFDAQRWVVAFLLPLLADGVLGSHDGSMWGTIRHVSVWQSWVACWTYIRGLTQHTAPGEPSVAGTLADIEAAYECLLTRYGKQPRDIVLYGQSVGR